MLRLHNRTSYISANAHFSESCPSKTGTEEWDIRTERIYKAAAILALLLLCASFVPIVVVSFYAHAVADDYSFSYLTFQAIGRGEGFIGLLRAAAREVSNVYASWQGTYSAVFLFSLQPAIYGNSYYWITTLLMAGFVSLGAFLLVDTICVRCGVSRWYGLLLSSILVLTQIQFMPSVAEGLYWYNGAAYYSIYYALALVEYALVLRLGTKCSAAFFVLCCVLSAFIGGGNYTTALFLSELLVLTLAVVWRDRKKRGEVTVLTLLVIGGLLVSGLAPGNAARSSLFEGMPALSAVAEAIRTAFRFEKEWLRLPQLAVCVLAFPLCNRLLALLEQRMEQLRWKTGWRFACWLLALAAAFGLYASQMVPPLYAMASIGAGRQVNVYYYSFLWLLLAEECALLGLIRSIRKIIFSHSQAKGNIAAGSQAANRGRRYSFLSEKKIGHIVRVILFAASGLLWFAGACSKGLGSTTSGMVTKSYLAGEVQTYAAEFRKIDQVLENSVQRNEKSVVLPAIPSAPACFEYFDLSKEDPDYWGNRALARYYGLEAVTFAE